MARPVSKTTRHGLLRRILKLSSRGPGVTQPPETLSAEAGLTLLECLVAIAVIGITATLIIPPLLVATASRVQNRRAEQAFQVAQGEIDRIQTLVAQGGTNYVYANLPPIATGTNPGSVAAPTGVNSDVFKSVNATCNRNYPPSTTQTSVARVIPVDVDGVVDAAGRCSEEFYMQVFMIDETPATTPPPTAPTRFKMGVRVYSSLANGTTWTGRSAIPLSLLVTRGNQGTNTGDNSQRVRPLVALYPVMVQSDRSASLCDFQGGSSRGCN